MSFQGIGPGKQHHPPYENGVVDVRPSSPAAKEPAAKVQAEKEVTYVTVETQRARYLYQQARDKSSFIR